MKFRVKEEKISLQSLVLAVGVRGPLDLAGGGAMSLGGVIGVPQ